MSKRIEHAGFRKLLKDMSDHFEGKLIHPQPKDGAWAMGYAAASWDCYNAMRVSMGLGVDCGIKVKTKRAK